MLTYIHITSLYRVMVNVIELLPHNFFIPHKLGMSPFLPDLIDAVDLMRAFSKSKTLKGAFSMRELEVVDDVSRRVGLEASHRLCKVRRLSKIVEMIF